MDLPLTLDALRVLDAIDRRGSFAGAASELNRVTSAVSYAVRKLEDDLGVTLFDREGHRARLTPAGQLVVERGRELLAAAGQLAADARERQDGWETTLSIAVDDVLETDTLYPFVARLQASRPGLDIRLMTEVLGGTWEALECGRADIAIAGILSRHPLPAGIRTESLGETGFTMCCSPRHPAALEPGPLGEEALRRHRIIAVADSARVSPPLSVGLLDRQPTLTVTSFRAKESALVAGLGIGTLPAHRLAPLMASERLVPLETRMPRDPVTMVMAWRASGGGRARRHALKVLPDFIRAGRSPGR